MIQTTIPGGRCTQIGCDYAPPYSDPKAIRRAMSEHLSAAHGVGRLKGAEAYLGCFYRGCDFKVAGSMKFTIDELRAHLVAIHDVNPGNPSIPDEVRRGDR